MSCIHTAHGYFPITKLLVRHAALGAAIAEFVDPGYDDVITTGENMRIFGIAIIVIAISIPMPVCLHAGLRRGIGNIDRWAPVGFFTAVAILTVAHGDKNIPRRSLRGL